MLHELLGLCPFRFYSKLLDDEGFEACLVAFTPVDREQSFLRACLERLRQNSIDVFVAKPIPAFLVLQEPLQSVAFLTGEASFVKTLTLGSSC